MRGRHHLLLSLLSVFPFVLPFFLASTLSKQAAFALLFLLAVAVGSLAPDADAPERSLLHYRFRLFDLLLRFVFIKPVLFLFRMLYRQEIVPFEAREEHRGLFHAPIGVLSSSLFLTGVVVTIAAVFGLFSWLVLLLVFCGLLLGQLLHLLEDSCTRGGIDWAFPFGSRRLRGAFVTRPRPGQAKDVRPGFFVLLLVMVDLFLTVVPFSFLALSLPLFFLVSFIVLAGTWLLFLHLARSSSSFWAWPPWRAA
jgi:hypothetical protein